MEAFDLIVIGTGTAAQVAAGRVRHAGRSVAVIDHRPFGGTCALRGCDPKKMPVSGAETLDLSRRMRGRGVRGDLRMDWKDLTRSQIIADLKASVFAYPTGASDISSML
jgi:glutathione reductase (NADPH)